ncbi:MAG: hypothetical protein AMXMBFR84_46970 [Candidatus Hydrogenedentota bacterium]
MDRRHFLEILAATAGSTIAAAQTGNSQTNATDAKEVLYTLSGLFPPLPPVSKLIVCPLHKELPWDDVVALTSFQGLVNRVNPCVYFVQDEHDSYWLDYYTKLGIETSVLDDPYQLFGRMEGFCNGYTLCDEDVLDTVNIAMMQGSANGTVPATRATAKMLERLGLKPLSDLTGRWKNRRDLYTWALENLASGCNARLIGSACTDYPNWTATGVYMRDFLVAHRIFTCDLSASIRDREEYSLHERVFASFQAPGCALGWRCICCNEHEYVALAARHGHSVLCALACRNLTVHQSIETPKRPRVQSHRKMTDLTETRDKVYISFMNTDGDAVWSVLQRNAGRFAEEAHGSIPYNWGVLPVAVDLMPAVMNHLYELKTPNDYFVAPTNGVLYTYPFLHPNAAGYLRETGRYMDAAGLRVAYMANWDDDHWWQEVDLPSFVPMLRRELPDCLGFVRGMGASAFEKDYLGGGAPYIYCGEAIHRHSDVYKTIRDFMDANPNRPLFWYCLVNHNVTLKTIHEAVKRLPEDEIEVVLLDELFLRIRDSYEQGRITGDTLYPDKRGVLAIQQAEAREAWPGICTTIGEHASRTTKVASAFLQSIDDPVLMPPIRNGSVSASDIVTHTAIWDAMSLTRIALNIQGIYVNNKERGVADFEIAFGDISDASIVAELWEAWTSWQTHRTSYEQAVSYARRLNGLAERLSSRFGMPHTG